jgi:hypothetical protein
MILGRRFFLGLFKSKPAYRDRVWSSQALKEQDIVRGIRESLSRGYTPISVIHFHNSLDHYRRLFANAGISVHLVKDLSELDVNTPPSGHTKGDVFIMDSDLITPSALMRSHKRSNDTTYSLHLLERYPIPEPDQRILDFLNLRSDFAPPIAYVSFDEPWLVRTLGDRLTALMERIGINKNEVIEHKLVSNSLQRAQEKLGKMVRRDFPQDTQDKWLEFNLRD